MDNLAARQQMVDQQVRTWEVLDPRVLEALYAGTARSVRACQLPRACIRRFAASHRLGAVDASAPKIQGRILQSWAVDFVG